MKPDGLKELYRYNEEHRRFIVEISLDYYRELFNDWDAAPMPKKDLDPELVDYLEQVALDIPLKQNIEIRFILPRGTKNPNLEHISRNVFSHYYLFLIRLNQRQIRRYWKKALVYILTGFLFLSVAYLMQRFRTLSFDIFAEGLFIGGWVFLWEAVSLLFFHISELRTENKRHARYASAPITYQYHPNPSQ